MIKAKAGKLEQKTESNKIIEQSPVKNSSQQNRKPTFNEQREYELLTKEIEQLESKKVELESCLNASSSNHEELINWGKELQQTKSMLDEKGLRWLELDEIIN